MYENIHGLSCIENHVLALMRQNGEQIEHLYNDSAIPAINIYNSVVINDIKQEYFNNLKRVQNTLKDLNVISFTKKAVPCINELYSNIRECSNNEYILARVTPEFSRRVLKARALRSDHFVLIKIVDSDFIVFNDIPECVLRIPITNFDEAFDKEFFKLSILRKLNSTDFNNLWETRLYKPENCNETSIAFQNFYDIDNIGIKLRDLAGVCKILRRRMMEYYNLYIDAEFIKETIQSWDKAYTLFEYYNIKKNQSLKDYYLLLYSVAKIDNQAIEILKKKVDKYYDKRKN